MLTIIWLHKILIENYAPCCSLSAKLLNVCVTHKMQQEKYKFANKILKKCGNKSDDKENAVAKYSRMQRNIL